jgi:hypothetical protein
MIKSITVTNHLGESIKLELRSPEKTGFLVQEITGLGPSKASINSTELSTTDGSIYNSARLDSRNIVLTLKLMAKPTVETTRQLSYKYFPIKKSIRLLIETDNRTCETYGYVESNEPNIFSNSESTQISIMCPDPYLYSSGEDGTTITIFSGIEPSFEFPFSNESLVENLINMGSIETYQEQNVPYNGESEIGVTIFIHAIGNVTNLIISNSGTGEVMKINTDRLATLTGFGIIAGDDIIISTIRGSKYVVLIRDGLHINILNCLDRNIDWFQLTRGDNIFAFSSDTGVTNLQFRIENKTVYEGV